MSCKQHSWFLSNAQLISHNAYRTSSKGVAEEEDADDDSVVTAEVTRPTTEATNTKMTSEAIEWRLISTIMEDDFLSDRRSCCRFLGGNFTE